MSEVTCRGSYMLGSACQKCKRCKEEFARITGHAKLTPESEDIFLKRIKHEADTASWETLDNEDLLRLVAIIERFNVTKLVDKFLAWPLPKSVRPDGDPNGDRSGTNLLTADEARQMFQYLLESK